MNTRFLVLTFFLTSLATTQAGIRPSELHRPEPVIQLSAPVAAEEIDNEGKNKEWHEAGYLDRLAMVLGRKEKVEGDLVVAAVEKRANQQRQELIRTLKLDIAAEMEKKGGLSPELVKRFFFAEQLAKADASLNEEVEEEVRSHKISRPQRWWRGAEAFGAAPGVLGDVADLFTFAATSDKAIAAGAALAGLTRAADTGLNSSFAHSPLSAHEADAYQPGKKVGAQTRAAAARKSHSHGMAGLLNGLNRYFVQPGTLITDTALTLHHRKAIAAYNQYLENHKDDPRIAAYRKRFNYKRLAMGGLMGLEALLHALKYAAYLKQGGNPSEYYANSGDANWVQWSNTASALASAVSMARRVWWNWTKSQHIDQAQELEQMRNPLPVLPVLE